MALKPSIKYPNQIDTTDPVGYPHGKGKNILVEGDKTGTPFEADLVNDLFGFQQAMLVAAGVTPSNVPDKANASQYLDALRTIFTRMFGAATQVQVHTASSTGNPIPAEVTEIEVTVVGGGGGGASGSRSDNTNGGNGGGAGHIYRTRLPRSQVGDTYDVTIGPGGAGGVWVSGFNAVAGSGGGGTSVNFVGPGGDPAMQTIVTAAPGDGGGLTAGGNGSAGGGGSGNDASGAGRGGARGSQGEAGLGFSGHSGGTGASANGGAGCDGGAPGAPTGIPLMTGGGGAGGPLGADGLVIVKASDGTAGTGSHTTGGKGGYGYGAGGGGGGQGATPGVGGEAALGVAMVTFHYGAS